MQNLRQFLKVGHELKEIMIDVDSRYWWVDGMITSYHLTIENCLHLRHDYKSAVFVIVNKEFVGLDKNNLVFK